MKSRSFLALALASTLGRTQAQTPSPAITVIPTDTNTAVVLSWASFPGADYTVLAAEALEGGFADGRTNRVRAQSTVTHFKEAAAQGLQFYSVRPESYPTESGAADTNTVRIIESIAGLEFTDTQRSQILQLLDGGVVGLADGQMLSLDGWARVRSAALPQGSRPALGFDPRPSGFQVNQVQDPISWPTQGGVGLPTNRTELAFYSVPQLAELLRTRQITAKELTQLYLERLKDYDPVLHCVVTLTEDLAMRKAEQVDEEIATGNYRGMLHGIPYGLKDLIAVKGYPTTWGAEPFQDQVLDRDATVYQKLDQAGAILIAKLATGALAAGDNWFGGETRNPWDPSQPSGGSSAGPPAATAAGLVGFAIGTETMGSLVGPSATCRVTGLRPSYGRVSRAGIMTLSWSMDKVGAICRSAEGCAAIFNVLRGADLADRSAIEAAFNYRPGRGLTGRRVGYVEGQVSPAALDILRALGAELVKIQFPSYPSGAMLSIMAVEGAAAFDELTRTGALDSVTPQNTYDLPNLIRAARTVSAVDYLRADRLRAQLIEDMGALFRTIDLYVTPYASDENLALANLAGLPSVATPDQDGGSLLFVGSLYDEATVLESAGAFQSVTTYHLQHPPLFLN